MSVELGSAASAGESDGSTGASAEAVAVGSLRVRAARRRHRCGALGRRGRVGDRRRRRRHHRHRSPPRRSRPPPRRRHHHRRARRPVGSPSGVKAAALEPPPPPRLMSGSTPLDRRQVDAREHVADRARDVLEVRQDVLGELVDRRRPPWRRPSSRRPGSTSTRACRASSSPCRRRATSPRRARRAPPRGTRSPGRAGTAARNAGSASRRSISWAATSASDVGHLSLRASAPPDGLPSTKITGMKNATQSVTMHALDDGLAARTRDHDLVS